MHRIATVSLRLLIALVLSLALLGCDDSPTSVQDFDVQPNMEVSASSVTFVDGQTPSPKIEVTYQGIDRAPEGSVTGALQLEKQSETGSPDGGSQVWALSYGEDLNQDQVNESLILSTSGPGREIADTISVQVNNPISVSASFESDLAAVADYEERDRSEQGETSIQINDTQASPNSTGKNVLQVDGSSSGSFTIERRASLPEIDIFSFLVKPDPNTDFDLTITFEEEAGSETRSEEVTVTVPSGDTWQKVSIAAGSLFPNFDPVAERAGGNGPLTSISFSADSDITYYVDQIDYGTTSETLVEIADFEKTTLEYSFGGVELDVSENVATPSDGFISRDLDSPGDGGFGYNYDGLRLDATGTSVVSLRIGQVTEDFNLYVFLETDNGEGGFSFDNGTEVEISGESEWRTITIPVTDLGGDDADPSALKDPGLNNVGFEVRRKDGDDSSAPIDFLIDDIWLVQ